MKQVSSIWIKQEFTFPIFFPWFLVSKLKKELVLLEGEKQHLQDELEKTKGEAQESSREVHVLQARLKDSITWEEHCSIAGRLRRCPRYQFINDIYWKAINYFNCLEAFCSTPNCLQSPPQGSWRTTESIEERAGGVASQVLQLAGRK